MSRRQKEPLRPLTPEEYRQLEHLARTQSAPAGQVAHAKGLLAVAAGQPYQDAARAAGRRSGDAVAQVVARFNHTGLAAVQPRHGGGPTPRYGAAEQARILAEAQRVPDREQDGTATWSLTTLQCALRGAPDGLPQVSTWTIWRVLHGAGLSWQRDRSWCDTGTAQRKRRDTTVTVHDPDAAAKKA
jgi:transposase